MTSAKEIVKNAAARQSDPVLSRKLRAELNVILKHNDQCTANTQRVGISAVLALFREHKVLIGRRALDRICASYGRKNFAKK